MRPRRRRDHVDDGSEAGRHRTVPADGARGVGAAVERATAARHAGDLVPRLGRDRETGAGPGIHRLRRGRRDAAMRPRRRRDRVDDGSEAGRHRTVPADGARGVGAAVERATAARHAGDLVPRLGRDRETGAGPGIHRLRRGRRDAAMRPRRRRDRVDDGSEAGRHRTVPADGARGIGAAAERATAARHAGDLMPRSRHHHKARGGARRHGLWSIRSHAAARPGNRGHDVAQGLYIHRLVRHGGALDDITDIILSGQPDSQHARARTGGVRRHLQRDRTQGIHPLRDAYARQRIRVRFQRQDATGRVITGHDVPGPWQGQHIAGLAIAGNGNARGGAPVDGGVVEYQLREHIDGSSTGNNGCPIRVHTPMGIPHRDGTTAAIGPGRSTIAANTVCQGPIGGKGSSAPTTSTDKPLVLESIPLRSSTARTTAPSAAAAAAASIAALPTLAVSHHTAPCRTSRIRRHAAAIAAPSAAEALVEIDDLSVAIRTAATEVNPSGTRHLLDSR
ncbi:Uncharacterised protein [Delftia tsuruhatensis]|nr:Uncharacterised protein [Delftia tsuruhatensis]